MARVTLQTIADAVGVTRMSVSNAFSRPARLSPEMRERILAVAEELGYAGPDPAARAFARGSTGVVGILVGTSLRNVFADEVTTASLGAIADGLAGTGLSLTLLSIEDTDGWVPARDVPMDATLVFTSRYEETAMGWLHRRKLPLVLLDQEPVDGVASVNVDDHGGAQLAAQHLLDLGHRRIGIVTVGMAGPFGVQADADADPATPDSYIADQRITGWLETLTAGGVTPVVVKQPKMPYRPETDGHAALSLLLDADPTVTGVLCFSDRFAAGVLAAAQDRGLTVPGDLSVIGFDDSPMASNLRPALTTVRQDLTAKGHAAAAGLVAAVNSRSPRAVVPESAVDNADSATHVVIPAELVVRDSTAPPPGAVSRSARTGQKRRSRAVCGPSEICSAETVTP